jgi:glycine/D-amino acid oxidase-like deaminating enzyme/nitrite reductase/ring-hydroxylating ferredoxin subunit
MPSLWVAETEPLPFPPLDKDASCDLVVVGSGIAGLSSAYEAARFGAKVIVIDRGDIARGMTARTTAHLVTEIDDRYFELVRAADEESAKLYHDSQVAAVSRIAAICEEEGIDADFTRVPGYLVAGEASDLEELNQEYDACRKLGVAVELCTEAPLPLIEGTSALKFPDQGRFHPLKYCAGLALAIQQRGGRLHGHTAYVGHDENGDGVTIETEAGHKIRAGAAMFATNSPVNDRVKVHAKQVPMRTYAMAGKIPAGSVEDALIWDTLRPYHYIRLQPAGDGQDWLIVGGEDHRTGTANDMEERFARLVAWTRERFPSFRKAAHRWSGQVMEPVDFLPFSGRDGSERIYLHSGDSGTGMSNGVAGALNFAALYRDGTSRFAALFDPARKPKSARSLGEFAKSLAPVAASISEHLTPGEADSADQIKPGEGAILRRGTSKLAVSRAKDGSLIERSAACTHLGCVVHWNSFEQCWDCPCHGSQFLPDGSVLNAPAIRPLASVDQPAEGQRELHEAK